MQGSQDTFYLTLPSNGYDTIYRDNTPGRFKAKLLKTISLPGKEWEVALSNISFPSTLASKTGNDFRSLVDLDFMPDELTCTSMKQCWSIPRGNRTEQKEIPNLFGKKPQLGASYNKFIESNLYSPS